jgi:hypothetical protein
MITIEKVTRPVYQVKYGNRTRNYTRRSNCLPWLAKQIVKDLVKKDPGDYVSDEVRCAVYQKLIETQSVEDTQAWVREQMTVDAFCEFIFPVGSNDIAWP